MRFESRRRFGNGREGCEIEGEVYDFAGGGHSRLDRGDGIAGFGLGAGGEVDARGVVGGEVGNCLFTQAGVA